MNRTPPPLPTVRELRECDVARFVRSEDELDELLAYVQRTSFAPERPMRADAFGPTAPPPVPSPRVDLDAIVERLSSAPAPAGRMYLRRPTDPSFAWDPINFDEVLAYVSMTPGSERGSLEPPALPQGTIPRWQLAAVGALAFALGWVLTLGLVGTLG